MQESPGEIISGAFCGASGRGGTRVARGLYDPSRGAIRTNITLANKASLAVDLTYVKHTELENRPLCRNRHRRSILRWRNKANAPG